MSQPLPQHHFFASGIPSQPPPSSWLYMTPEVGSRTLLAPAAAFDGSTHHHSSKFGGFIG
ncbi:zinc finger protein 6-like, partial [Trifolium medium]|nr:zinc finger protein 6-like [Trifolium medium]